VTGTPTPYLCTQVGLFNDFGYSPSSSSVSGVAPPSGSVQGGQTVTVTGYDLTVASDGGIFTFGTAGFYGSMAA